MDMETTGATATETETSLKPVTQSVRAAAAERRTATVETEVTG